MLRVRVNERIEICDGKDQEYVCEVIEIDATIVKTKVVQEELESRKKVERAKGILMQEQNLSEQEAYDLIRKSSMTKRVHMKEIAEAIILSHEIRR